MASMLPMAGVAWSLTEVHVSTVGCSYVIGAGGSSAVYNARACIAASAVEHRLDVENRRTVESLQRADEDARTVDGQDGDRVETNRVRPVG
jgi:hypothetical protein